MTESSLRSEMPHYARVAWNVSTNDSSSKGLNAYKIALAAIELADLEGIAAVTIRSIAKKTGFSTMAVYRHIESRDELMLLLVDVALGSAPTRAGGDWKRDVTDWAQTLLERYAVHPWVLDLPIGGIPTTPNHISWIEQVLRILAPTNLSLQKRLDVALLIDGHVRQFASLPASSSLKSGGEKELQWLQETAADVAPTLLLALQQGAMQRKKGPDFMVGMNIIISGIESLSAANPSNE